MSGRSALLPIFTVCRETRVFTGLLSPHRMCKRLADSRLQPICCRSAFFILQDCVGLPGGKDAMRFSYTRRRLAAAAVAAAAVSFVPLGAQQQEKVDLDAIYRIKDE